jgi:hypothetical protein
MSRTWPPTVADVKLDADIATSAEDERLSMVVDAAVSWVQSRRTRFNYSGDPLCLLPDPTDDLWLGTVRLAGRWHDRRRSPDGMVNMGDLGSTRVASIDTDIQMLLGIGRFRKGAFA